MGELVPLWLLCFLTPVTDSLHSVLSKNTTWNCSICFPFSSILKGHSCILTDRGQCWGRNLDTGATVQYSAIGTHAHWTAGAEQTQPLTLLPVTWVGHYDMKQQCLHATFLLNDQTNLTYLCPLTLHKNTLPNFFQ